MFDFKEQLEIGKQGEKLVKKLLDLRIGKILKLEN